MAMAVPNTLREDDEKYDDMKMEKNDSMIGR